VDAPPLGLEVHITLAGQVQEFDGLIAHNNTPPLLLLKLADFVCVPGEALHLKSVTSASVRVVIGVDPTYGTLVQGRLRRASGSTLSSALSADVQGVTVIEVQDTQGSPLPLEVAVAVAAIAMLALKAVLLVFCFQRRQARLASLKEALISDPEAAGYLDYQADKNTSSAAQVAVTQP